MRSIKAIVGQRQTIIVDALTTVGDAARLMASHQIGAVPVLEGERLAGIFTERDVLTRVVAAARDAERTPVREVMSTRTGHRRRRRGLRGMPDPHAAGARAPLDPP